MTRILTILPFILLAITNMQAQKGCCDNNYNAGQRNMKAGNYAEAIRYFTQGSGCGTLCNYDFAQLIQTAKQKQKKTKQDEFQDEVDSPPVVVRTSTPTHSVQEPSMVQVQAGTFQMGCTAEQGSECGSDEKVVRNITLRAYAIGKYEVTVGQYLAFCEDTGGNWPEWLEKGSEYNVETGKDKHYKDKGYKRNGAESLPIVGISWNNAKAYCEWLSRKTGKNYRLPTEAEWEYAARGGNQSKGYKYSGSNTVGDVAWLSDNAGSKPHTVGGKQANELGIHDMSGNVWEWCYDWYASNYNPNDLNNPKGAGEGTTRVLRGGSWYYGALHCRVSDRNGNTPTIRYYDLGFRVALSL